MPERFDVRTMAVGATGPGPVAPGQGLRGMAERVALYGGELETAVRLGTPFVTVVWEDGGYGSITWKQTQRFGRHFGTTFGNPDFVALAESFGLAAWRCEDAGALADRLRHALGLDVASLLAVPIDYSVDVAITGELGEDTLAT